MSRLRAARAALGLLILISAVGLALRAFLLEPVANQPIGLSQARYLTVPRKCSASTKLLVCVFSKPINVENRLTIRDTWGRAFSIAGAEVVFLLGYSRGLILEEEIREYGDIIQEDFKDSYYNLTLKSLAMVRYAATYCPQVQHVLKVDDDVLINTRKFLTDIKHLNTPKTIWGNLAQGWTPIRQPRSKWYVPPYLYNGTRFPDFVTGVGYMMSGDCPALLYTGSQDTRYFFLEDVFWTGIVAEKMGIARFAQEGFSNSRVFLRACDTSGGPWFMSHGYPPEYMRISWQSLQRRLKMCDKIKKSSTSGTMH
ncbi:beta-1 [Tropilaelaps mercedesae]|uniref:Hexosyltransferase n=1 Tax=Tropilaelaps mercedesae TaxID=418985 RepID=A0A1V9X0U9_9ACAR|nr:beta-1 [Tropilaelaps mercedesae]